MLLSDIQNIKAGDRILWNCPDKFKSKIVNVIQITIHGEDFLKIYGEDNVYIECIPDELSRISMKDASTHALFVLREISDSIENRNELDYDEVNFAIYMLSHFVNTED